MVTKYDIIVGGKTHSFELENDDDPAIEIIVVQNGVDILLIDLEHNGVKVGDWPDDEEWVVYKEYVKE